MEKVFGVLSGKEIDDDLYDELEEALIQATSASTLRSISWSVCASAKNATI